MFIFYFIYEDIGVQRVYIYIKEILVVEYGLYCFKVGNLFYFKLDFDQDLKEFLELRYLQGDGI